MLAILFFYVQSAHACDSFTTVVVNEFLANPY